MSAAGAPRPILRARRPGGDGRVIWWPTLLAGLALLAAGAGQWLLDRRLGLAWVVVLFAGAVVVFVWAQRRQAAESAPEAVAGVRRRTPWPILAVALVLGLVAFPRFSGNQFRWDGTLLWVLGLLALLGAAWYVDRPAPPAPAARAGAKQERGGLLLRWHHLLLLGIMLVGAFFRFYRLGTIPLEMGCDLPHNFFNIQQILRGDYLVFFPSWPGREGLFFYLAAPISAVLGLSHVSIKMAAALVGVLTLPALYWLGQELFDRQVGLYAAALMSISHWHVILTRVGLRLCTMPLFVILVWGCLVRGLRTGRRWWFALAGLSLGLGMYTYNAFMVVPPLVLLMLLAELAAGRGANLRRRLADSGWLWLLAAFAFIPLGRYVYEQPAQYLFRVATRLTAAETSLPRDLLGTALHNALAALGMFNVMGDSVPVNNIPLLREFDLLPAVLLPLGLGLVLWRWRRGYNAGIILAFGVLLLPSALALAFPQEVPNAGRAVGVLPPALLLAALALALAQRQLSAGLSGLFREPGRVHGQGAMAAGGHLACVPGGDVAGSAEVSPAVSEDKNSLRPSLGRSSLKRVFGAIRAWCNAGKRQSVLRGIVVQGLPCALVVAALLGSVLELYPLYFQTYVENLPARNYSISLEMARAIDAFAGQGDVYIKTRGYWYDGNAVRAQLRVDTDWDHEIWTLESDQPPLLGGSRKVLVIVHPDDSEALQQLRAAFPRSIELEHDDYDGNLAFITFYGERQE